MARPIRPCRAPEAAATLHVSLSTLWRLVRTGQLPRPFRLSERCVGWDAADLEAYLAKQKAESGEAA